MNGKNYKLRVLPLFEEDLNRILEYISVELKNPIAAENLLEKTEKEVYDRLPFAEAFEKYASEKERKLPYYRINVDNYIIFYVVDGNVMELRRMLYGRRDYNEII